MRRSRDSRGVAVGLAGMPTANAVAGDDYLERMVKYVPAEIIAGSMLINAILDQAMKLEGRTPPWPGSR